MSTPMLFAFALVLLACGGHVQAQCPPEPGWALGPSKKYCYFVSPSVTTWENARTTCKFGGAILATIDNARDNKFLVEQIRPDDAWIGFSDRGREGQWIWEGGSGTSFTNWNTATREPNNKRNQDCAVIVGVKKHGLKVGKWDDRKCKKSYRFICRRDPEAVAPAPLTDASMTYERHSEAVAPAPSSNTYMTYVRGSEAVAPAPPSNEHMTYVVKSYEYSPLAV